MKQSRHGIFKDRNNANIQGDRVSQALLLQLVYDTWLRFTATGNAFLAVNLRGYLWLPKRTLGRTAPVVREKGSFQSYCLQEAGLKYCFFLPSCFKHVLPDTVRNVDQLVRPAAFRCNVHIHDHSLQRSAWKKTALWKWICRRCAKVDLMI